MTDYSIKKHLLTEKESSRLEQLGVELAPSSLKLERALSRREMLEVWGIIWALRERTADPENGIQFAVGDWLVAAESRFGNFCDLVREDGLPRPRVMICYKHQDSERDQWVQRLCTDLRSKFGVDAKLDDFEVDYGQSFSDYMTSEIDRECDALLFVITSASVAAVDEKKAGGVHFEMQLANARRIRDLSFRIIGVYREGTEMTSYLHDLRYIDFRDDGLYGTQIRELALSLWGQRNRPLLRDQLA